MSLTSFLRHKEVKERFSQEFIKPKFLLKSEIKASPLTNHYSLVGTAFDYLLRFYIERLNSTATIRRETWVAENFKESVNDRKNLSKCNSLLENAKKHYLSYQKYGKINSNLLQSTLHLAQLDVIYRADILDENLGKSDRNDIKDLMNLIKIINPKFFKANKFCALNPTFNEASELVGGADCDVIIDKTLIEIKTTKNLELAKDDFHQLIGYYTLYKVAGLTNVSLSPKIDTLAIYYSRYGILYKIPVKSIINDAEFPKFVKWFKKKAKEIFPAPGLEWLEL